MTLELQIGFQYFYKVKLSILNTPKMQATYWVVAVMATLQLMHTPFMGILRIYEHE